MGNIVLLDELTINKIAAGEVIERPASVIKEMVENSIDAKAKNITIEIKNGGISFIRITDNGKGIAKDDIELAFERHATSKIRSAEDLDTVKTMGFRGEALASVAAISNVELVSKTENDLIGSRIVVEGGDVVSLDEIGCSQGTTITVRNLFYNTPVRYKFLKKDFTESGYIEDVVTRIALIHPEVAIRLINSGKTVIQTNGNGDVKGVIYSIFGKEVASNILNIEYEYEYIKIKGIIGKPNIARSNRSNQIFFVNKRYIKDKTLSSAVEQAFKGLLPIGKFPFLVLNIKMSPAKVDVNVHPAKLEVRFAEENIVFKSVFHAIKDTLLKKGFLTDREKTKEIKEASKEAFKIENVEENVEKTYTVNSQSIISKGDYIEKLKTLQEDLQKEVSKNPEIKLTDEYKKVQEKYEQMMNVNSSNKEELNKENENIELDSNPNEKQKEINYNQETSLEEEITENTDNLNETEQNEIPSQEEDLSEASGKMVSFEEMYKQLFGKEPYGGKKQEQKESEEKNYYTIDASMEDSNVSIFEQEGNYKQLQYKFIGIAFNTYIILEIENELYIMDQHAAHERIMYEKVKKNFYSEGSKVSQLLLLPDIIELTNKEMDIAKDNMDLFTQAGFTLEEFGENTIKLTGVPEICIDLNTADLFKEMLDEINTVARTAKQEKEEKFIATIACKAAVKANMKLEKEEVDKLMEQLLKLPNPFTCPHGRPTVIKMTKYEIERKFARK